MTDNYSSLYTSKKPIKLRNNSKISSLL